MAGDYRGLARRKGKDFLNIKIPYDTAGKKRNFAGIRRKMFEPKASFFLRCKVQWNGGYPKGKEFGHLFLLTLLWCTKE